MWNYLKARMGNYGFWLALAAAIMLVLTSCGVQVDNVKIMLVIKAVLAVLVLLGLVNDPTTTAKWFGDDKAAATTEQPKA